MSEKKILVSGCLFGWHCRYDDGNTPCLHPQFLKWKEEGDFLKFLQLYSYDEQMDCSKKDLLEFGQNYLLKGRIVQKGDETFFDELLLFVLGKIESALMRVIYPQCEVILDLTQYFQGCNMLTLT